MTWTQARNDAPPMSRIGFLEFQKRRQNIQASQTVCSTTLKDKSQFTDFTDNLFHTVQVCEKCVLENYFFELSETFTIEI